MSNSGVLVDDPAIRRVLSGADEVLLGVAFVLRRGISLLERELKPLTAGRLLTTTVFGSRQPKDWRRRRATASVCGC